MKYIKRIDMFDIITVGSALIDIFVDTGLHEKKRKIAYPVGYKFNANKVDFFTGGGGSNTAVGFSRLGFKTGYLGKIGNDYFGDIILNEFKKENVTFLGKHGNEKTGMSIILDSKEHHRTILTHRGASQNMKLSDISFNLLKTHWFYFGTLGKESFKTQEKLAQFAADHNIKIVFNPSMWLAKENPKILKSILKKTHVLIINKEEAEAFAGKKNAFKKLHKLGPDIVCITNGHKGSTVSDGEYIYKAGTHKIKVVEATGAGDAYAIGFVAGLMKANSIELAIQLGTANSESVIQRIGTKNKLLTWNEIMKKPKVKVTKEAIR